MRDSRVIVAAVVTLAAEPSAERVLMAGAAQAEPAAEAWPLDLLTPGAGKPES